ncbi:hypothetical protein I3760_09G126100 [Carya illinoinensis]|nr:hypothetical protein I3760_09G126100 [Carya illinoinensis]
MAGEQQMKPTSELLLIVNFCMYVVDLGIGARAMNRVIFDHGFIIGPRFDLLAHFLPIYFPIGNVAIGFFVTFSLIAGVVGVASAISGLNHVPSWTAEGYCCLG